MVWDNSHPGIPTKDFVPLLEIRQKKVSPPQKKLVASRGFLYLTQPMDPEKKNLNFIFPTKYVIPKSLKFSHWLSEIHVWHKTSQEQVSSYHFSSPF